MRNWTEFQYAVENMPPGSHTAAANASDLEMAEAILELSQGKNATTTTRPPLKGWNDLRSDLAQIIDLLHLQVSGGGDKWKPTPRPETAMEIVKRERKEKKLGALSSKLTGQ